MSYNQKPPGPGGSGLPPNSSKNAQVAQAFLGIQQQMQSLVHGQNAQQGDLNAFLTQQQRIQNIFKQQQFLQQHYQQQMQQQQTQHHSKERGSNTGNEPLALTRTPGAAELLNKTFQQHHQQQQANGSSVAAAAAAVANPTLNQIQQQLQAMSPNIMQQIQAFQYQMQQQHHSQAAQSQIQQTSSTNSTTMHQQHSQQHHHQNQHGHQHQHSHQQQQLHHQHPQQQQQQKAYSSAVQQFQQSFQKHYYAQTAAAVTKANAAGSLPPPLTNQKKTPTATSSQISTVHPNVSNMANVGTNSSLTVLPSNPPASSVNRQGLLSVPIMPPSKTISPATSPTISKPNQPGKVNMSDTSSVKTGSSSTPVSNASTLQKVHEIKIAEDSNITAVASTVAATNLKIDKIAIPTKPVEQKEAVSLTKQVPMVAKSDKPNDMSIERISTDEDKKTDAISKTKNEITTNDENVSIKVSDKVEAKLEIPPVQCTEESSTLKVNSPENPITKEELESDNKDLNTTDIKQKVTETSAGLPGQDESVKTEDSVKDEFIDKESIVENKSVSNSSKGEQKDDAEVLENEQNKGEEDDVKEEKSDDKSVTKGENNEEMMEIEQNLKEDLEDNEMKPEDIKQLSVTSTSDCKEAGKILKESENILKSTPETEDEQNTIENIKEDSDGKKDVSEAANISIEILAKDVDSEESIKESSIMQSSKKISRQSKHGKSSALTHTSKISEKGITITIRAPKEKKKLKSPEPTSDCKSDIDSKHDEMKSKSHTEENTNVQSQKLENENNTEEGNARKSKRHRYKTFLYQSPLPELAYITKLSASEASNSPKHLSNEDKLTLFYKNEYMAVRNEEGTFYLCQTMQNVYRTSPRISIRWLSEDSKKLGVFNPDFYDHIDIESVLTTVDLQKIDKDHWRLPETEKKRIENILKKAIDVEKGVAPRPELSEQNPDGLDISLYKSESQIERKSMSGSNSQTPKKTKSKISHQASEPNNTGKRKSTFNSKSTGSSAKRLAKSLSMKKRKNASKKRRRSTISSSDEDVIESSDDDEEDIEYKPSQKKSVSCTATKSSPRSQRSPLAKARAASPITPTSSRMNKVVPLKVSKISTLNLSSPSMRNERAKKRNSLTDIDHDLHLKKTLPTTSGNTSLNVTPTKNLKTAINKAKGNETSNEPSEAKSSTSAMSSNPSAANNNSRPTRNRK